MSTVHSLIYCFQTLARDVWDKEQFVPAHAAKADDDNMASEIGCRQLGCSCILAAAHQSDTGSKVQLSDMVRGKDVDTTIKVSDTHYKSTDFSDL